MVGLENPLHWLVILVIALIVLGPRRLPQAGRALGEGIREFRDSVRGLSGEADERTGISTTPRGSDGEEPLAAARSNRAIRSGGPRPLPPV